MLLDEKKVLEQAENAYENDNDELAISLFLSLVIDVPEPNPEALQFLSVIYRYSKEDNEKADYWQKLYVERIKNLANDGVQKYVMVLAQIFQYGDGLEINEEKAVSLFTELAENEYSEAQHHLANLFKHGWCGISENSKQYLYWLERAAENKWPDAMVDLAELVIFSDDSNENELIKAAKMLQDAKELGSWRADELLSTLK